LQVKEVNEFVRNQEFPNVDCPRHGCTLSNDMEFTTMDWRQSKLVAQRGEESFFPVFSVEMARLKFTQAPHTSGLQQPRGISLASFNQATLTPNGKQAAMICAAPNPHVFSIPEVPHHQGNDPG